MSLEAYGERGEVFPGSITVLPPTSPPHAILKTRSEGDSIIPLLLAFRDLQHCASSQHRPGTWL